MTDRIKEYLWACVGGSIVAVGVSFSISLLTMPIELRGGVESWRVENAVEIQTLKHNYLKLYDDAMEARRFCENVAIAVFSDEINAVLDKKEEIINEKMSHLPQLKDTAVPAGRVFERKSF